MTGIVRVPELLRINHATNIETPHRDSENTQYCALVKSEKIKRQLNAFLLVHAKKSRARQRGWRKER